MPRNGILPSTAGDFLVSFKCGSNEFSWLKKVSNCFFTKMMTSSTYLFHHGLGLHINVSNNCRYWETHCSPWEMLVEFSLKGEDTDFKELFSHDSEHKQKYH